MNSVSLFHLVAIITTALAANLPAVDPPTLPPALPPQGQSTTSPSVEVCQTCTAPSVLTCCQATFAGDLPTVQFLANLTGYTLDPRDVNCLGMRMDSYSDPASCVGVKTCCDVVLPSISTQGLGQPATGLVNTLVSVLGIGVGMYCQGINQTCGTQYGECGVYY